MVRILRLWILIIVVISSLAFGDSPKHSRSIYRIKTDSETIEGSSARRVTFEAHYPYSVDQVWKLLKKTDKYSEYIPRVLASESLAKGKEKGMEKLFIMMDIPLPFSDIWNVLLVTWQEDSKRIQWKLEDGNMKQNKGSLEVKKEKTGTEVRMDMDVEVEWGIPKWIVGWAAEKFLPKVLVAFGQQLGKKKSS